MCVHVLIPLGLPKGSLKKIKGMIWKRYWKTGQNWANWASFSSQKKWLVEVWELVRQNKSFSTRDELLKVLEPKKMLGFTWAWWCTAGFPLGEADSTFVIRSFCYFPLWTTPLVVKLIFQVLGWSMASR